MSVIINEFEIVIEPPDATEPPARDPVEEREERPALAPIDVQEVMRHALARSLRVFAH